MSRRPETAGELLDLLAAEQLLTDESLARLRFAWDAVEPVEPRLDELIAAGLLTAFQARCLRAGRPNRLRLGPFRLVDRLGRGASGVVFRAEQPLLNRTVVLKVFPRGMVPPEVGLMGTLSHPNIVAAHDARTISGRVVLVLEDADGIDLGDMVRRAGPLPAFLARAVAVGVLRALEHLARGGLVHGDVTPANILVGTDEAGRTTVKLIDLGLARRRGDLVEEPAGTIDYLAPERVVVGEEIDIRGDVYGLGATLFFALSGRVAYPGGSDEEKLLRVRLDPAPCVSELRSDLPPALTDAVRAMMTHDAERRPSPTQALELAGWYEGTVVAGDPTPVCVPKRRRPWPVGVVLAAVLVGGGVGTLVRGLRRDETPVPVPFRAAQPRAEVLPMPGREAFDLARAIRDAGDGATVTIPAGNYRLGPTALGSRRLTLSGPSAASCVILRDEPGDNRAMLHGEGSLAFRGVTLRVADAGCISPLVQVTGGSVSVDSCEIEHPGRATAISLRSGGALSIRDTHAACAGQVVAAETTTSGVRVTVERSTLTVGDAGVAVLLWREEDNADGPAALALSGCRVLGGRVVACRAVGSTAVGVTRCHLSFARAFASFAAYPDRETAAKALKVSQEGNTTIAAGAWVMIDGAEPAGASRGWSALGAVP